MKLPRRYKPRRKISRPAFYKKRFIKRRSPSTGGFYIKRRVQVFGLNGSTITVGAMTSSNAMFQLGTPILAQGGGANLYDVPFAVTFMLSNLDTYTDISNIADRYRLVNASIKLTTSNVALGAGAGLSMPWLEWIVDHDDDFLPTVSLIQQKMGVRTTGYNQRGQASMWCKPVPAAVVYQAPGANAYSVPSRSPYINTSYPSVPHYGIKGVLRGVYLPGASNCANFAVDVKYTVHAKDLQ